MCDYLTSLMYELMCTDHWWSDNARVKQKSAVWKRTRTSATLPTWTALESNPVLSISNLFSSYTDWATDKP